MHLRGDLKNLIANDPWTGKQVQIDPETKKVVAPENFPLDDFKVEDFLPSRLRPETRSTPPGDT